MKILVSSCLMGNNCKYNGGNNFSKEISEYVAGHEVIGVCPEVLGGLSIPRIPCEIVNGEVINREGISCDMEYRKGAEIALQIAKENDVDLAILQSRSPSCGCGKIYDGTFSRKLIDGNGIFADLMIKNGFSVMDSSNLIAMSKIKSILKSEDYVMEDVGMSQSDVYIFSDKVLKVQAQSEETDYESRILSWLADRIPSPRLLAYGLEDGKAYTLMEKVEGEMLCKKEYLMDSRKMLKVAADGLKRLWQVDITDFPGERKPGDDLVLCHGDYCLPNILAKGDELSGFIDLSRVCVDDRWRDIAVCIRSMERNLSGIYSGGKNYGPLDLDFFLQELGIEMNEEKMKYYLELEDAD